MDQLKTQLAVVLKYGFWITSALVLLGSLGVWFWTTSQLAAEAASQTSKINGAIGTVESVSAELPTLPNDHSHAEMERLIADRQDEVLKSWELLYERQRDILTWPVKELKQDFVDEFEPLIPIEIAVNFPTDPFDEKETTLLSRYQDYIKNVLPSIAEIANTEWTAEFSASASMMGGMGGMDDMEMDMGMGDYGAMSMARTNIDITGAQQGPLVQWGTDSQTQLLKDLFPWRGRQPTTLEVLYSQENLWILKQLLQIIDDVNGEARQPYQAKIHEIKRIGIGKSVKFGAGNISKPGATAMGGGMGMDMEGMDMDMEMDMEGMEMDMEGMGGMGFGTGSSSDPGDNRYFNASFEPITGAALRSALTSNSPSDASLAVAKRIPVMMSFNMDQRAVHELLAACGSADLMVEVNQVRVLPKSASSAGGMMMGGMDEMEGEDMMGGGMGGGMGMGMGMGMGGGGMPGMDQVDEFPLDMSVEIYGIIYIYNQPDPAKFGVEQVTEDTVIDGATETIGGTPVAPTAPIEGELPTPTQPAPAAPAPAQPAAPDPNTAAPPVTAAPGGGPPTAILPPVQP